MITFKEIQWLLWLCFCLMVSCKWGILPTFRITCCHLLHGLHDWREGRVWTLSQGPKQLHEIPSLIPLFSHILAHCPLYPLLFLKFPSSASCFLTSWSGLQKGSFLVIPFSLFLFPPYRSLFLSTPHGSDSPLSGHFVCTTWHFLTPVTLLQKMETFCSPETLAMQLTFHSVHHLKTRHLSTLISQNHWTKFCMQFDCCLLYVFYDCCRVSFTDTQFSGCPLVDMLMLQ
jgi:hypothetical protein